MCRRGWRTRSTYGDSADGLGVREWSEFKKCGRLTGETIAVRADACGLAEASLPERHDRAVGRTLALLAMNGKWPARGLSTGV